MKNMLVASEILTTGWCPLNCSYCVSGDTKILMADFSWKDMVDIEVGDKIIAVSEFPINGQRRFVIATVEAKHERVDDVYEVIFDDGTSIKVTDNHPLLGYDNKWYQLDINKPTDAPNKNALEVGVEICSVEISHHDSKDSSDFIDGSFVGRRVVEVRYLRRDTVYNIMTTSRTYISNGLVSHNCYIPKTDEMKELHLNIVRELKTRVRIQKMKEMKEKYGIKLEHLGAWGTEPLLTMKFINLEEWKREFPELKEFSYSTSMMVKPTPVIDKVIEANKVGIDIKHQVSLDGPEWITDKNRVGGSTKKIIENVEWLVKELNKIDFDIRFEISFKATWSIDNIRKMVESPELIHEVFEFFDDVVSRLRAVNKKSNIVITNFAGGTLVVPGKYTSDDGRVLAEFFKYLYEFGYPNNYTYRLMRILDFGHEIYKARMFTCSAMDSQFGFDDEGSVHMCHRTYYFNKDEYIKSVMNMNKYKNWDVSVMEEGRMREINKYYIVPYSDDFEMSRLYYVMRGYHDFWRFKVSYVVSMMRMLASVGQAEERFLKDDDYTLLFSFFINTAFSCPMENLLNTGSVHLTPVSILRYLGNGAFEWIVKDAYRIYKNSGVL